MLFERGAIILDVGQDAVQPQTDCLPICLVWQMLRFVRVAWAACPRAANTRYDQTKKCSFIYEKCTARKSGNVKHLSLGVKGKRDG